LKIGYACKTIGVPDTGTKSCLMKNANEERLLKIIDHNLNSLENTLDYAYKNEIGMFRICSELIPFGSSPVNRIHWWDVYKDRFIQIGDKIKQYGIRVSMHPGQYTVLNSKNDEVAAKAVDDLRYHSKVLDSLQLGPEHKIVLHVGGLYNDRKQSMERFITNYKLLDDSIRSRLVIENDDKCYCIKDVLNISENIHIPVIYDYLHDIVNPGTDKKSHAEWILACKKTWTKQDGIQKIHYSQQAPGKSAGSHSETIDIDKFLSFYNSIKSNNVDIMLEVKDKNLSAVKCIRAIKK
jgi:UV DNA damage endonuclease